MRLLLLFALLLILGAAPASAERRLALVIGNDQYVSVPQLKKAVNDARSIGTTLKGLGFEVDNVENAPRLEMSRRLSTFENRIQAGDTVFLFFAGHGFEIRGDNYLLPTDVPDVREGEEGVVKDAAFAAKDLLDRLQAKGVGTLIAVLDACRNNPFDRPGRRSVGGTRGLARIDPAEGVFVLFSAGAKQEALDELRDGDPDPNSVFTRVLIQQLATPGLSLVQIAKDTQAKVKTLAASVKHEQTPAYYDQIVGDFFLAKAAAGAPVPVAPPGPAVAPNPQPPAGQVATLGPKTAPAPADQTPDQLVMACLRLTANPKDPNLPPGVGSVADAKVDLTAAEQACRRARTAAPRDGRASFGLARTLDLKGDPGAAAPLYEEAANRDHPVAANHAGTLYYKGLGVAVDLAKARFYYEKAANGRYYGSTLTLADMLERGIGGPADPALAMGLLTTAAEAGTGEASFSLGVKYDQGVGAKRDAREARKWYAMSVKDGFGFAAFPLAVLVGHGQGGAADRTAAAKLAVHAFAAEERKDGAQQMRDMLKRFDPKVVAELEKYLASQGENPGPADGKLDDKTFAALDALAARIKAGTLPDPIGATAVR